MNKEFLDYLAEVYPESVILDGLDDGIIGVDVNEEYCRIAEKRLL